jgi:hypothetical protein
VPLADERTATKKVRYSITSSAMASNVDGTLMPSAFVVFILMTRSYLVCCLDCPQERPDALGLMQE